LPPAAPPVAPPPPQWPPVAPGQQYATSVTVAAPLTAPTTGATLNQSHTVATLADALGVDASAIRLVLPAENGWPVTVTFTSPGDVSDFDATDRATVKTGIATEAGVAESAVTVAVEAASVRVTVTITTASAAQATSIANTLTASLSSAGAATTVIGVTVSATPTVANGGNVVSWVITVTNTTVAANVNAALSTLSPAQMSAYLGVAVDAVDSVSLQEAVVLPAPAPPPDSGGGGGGGGGGGKLFGMDTPMAYAVLGSAVAFGLLCLIATCICMRKPHRRRNLHDEAVQRLSERQAKHRAAAGGAPKKPAPRHSAGSPQPGRNQLVHKDVLMSDGI